MDVRITFSGASDDDRAYAIKTALTHIINPNAQGASDDSFLIAYLSVRVCVCLPLHRHYKETHNYTSRWRKNTQ